MKTWPKTHALAANPAIVLWLQSTRPGGPGRRAWVVGRYEISLPHCVFDLRRHVASDFRHVLHQALHRYSGRTTPADDTIPSKS